MTRNEITALMQPVCDLVKQVCKKDKNFSIVISNTENSVSIQSNIEDAVNDRSTIYAIHSTCFYTLSRYDEVKRISFTHIRDSSDCVCIIDFYDKNGCPPNQWTSIRIGL